MNRCMILLCALPLSGCASMFTAVANRPITEDRLENELPGEKLKTLSGDRRLVRVDKYSQNLVTICAETQADAISARSAEGSLTVESRGGLTDKVGEALTSTYARTELSDIVRQLSWQICNAYMNALIDKDTYAAQLKDIQTRAFDVLKARSEKSGGGGQ